MLVCRQAQQLVVPCTHPNSCSWQPLCVFAQRSDQDHFLLEVPAAALGRDALVLAVSVSNLRHRVLHVCEHGAALARRGPAPEPCDSDEEAGTGAEAGSASAAAGRTPADITHTAGSKACSAEAPLEPMSSTGALSLPVFLVAACDGLLQRGTWRVLL